MTAADTPNREELSALIRELRARRWPSGLSGGLYARAADAIERLAAKPADGGVREATIEECKMIIDDLRSSEAGLFDAKHSGQRGQDRSDALYDAYQALRALSTKTKP